MMQLSAPLTQEWITQMNKSGSNGREMFDEARQLIRKHSR